MSSPSSSRILSEENPIPRPKTRRISVRDRRVALGDISNQKTGSRNSSSSSTLVHCSNKIGQSKKAPKPARSQLVKSANSKKSPQKNQSPNPKNPGQAVFLEGEKEKNPWSSSFCPSELVLTAQNLGLNPNASTSTPWDSTRGSVLSGSSIAGRRNSLDSSTKMGNRKSKKKQVKVTSLKPFKLRTEQRGKMKEEEFAKKLHEIRMEEEKMRIPIAQGLPWTTDEPECLVSILMLHREIPSFTYHNTRRSDAVVHLLGVKLAPA